MADNVCALNTWVNAHQPLFERLDDLTRKYGADQVNKLICLTPPLQAFSNYQHTVFQQTSSAQAAQVRGSA